ncbi:MAG TPA: LPXTG cell wall anchor domain-containing protein [Nocardioides sp.]|nr:LPXTG cell wall anchor domain-containing protein [Nocardioides sp.]
MLTRLAALCLLIAGFVAAPATIAAADPYSPKLPTQTHISADVQGPGKPVILHVSASANYSKPPTGDIKVKLFSASSTARGARAVAARPLLTTTVHFTNHAIRIEGPRLARGKYTATAAFSPDNEALFLPSDAMTAFRVGNDEVSPTPPDDNLPNTGGPDLLWLLLGGGLLAAGAGAIGFDRRRRRAVTS